MIIVRSVQLIIHSVRSNEEISNLNKAHSINFTINFAASIILFYSSNSLILYLFIFIFFISKRGLNES